MDLELAAKTSPQWPGKVPETPEEGRALWDVYLRSLEEATDLRARYLEAQAAHAVDTMHVYRRVSELEHMVSSLQAELSEMRLALRHMEGWVAGQGRRIGTIAAIVQS